MRANEERYEMSRCSCDEFASGILRGFGIVIAAAMIFWAQSVLWGCPSVQGCALRQDSNYMIYGAGVLMLGLLLLVWVVISMFNIKRKVV